MSSTDQTKDGSSIPSETTQRTSPQQSLSRLRQSITSSSSTRQTIPLPTYNSFLERVLRSSPETVDSFLPAITRIKSLNPSIADVPLLSSELKENKNKKSQDNSSRDLYPSWTESGLKLIRKSSQNSSTNISQIGEESSTNVKDTQ